MTCTLHTISWMWQLIGTYISFTIYAWVRQIFWHAPDICFYLHLPFPNLSLFLFIYFPYPSCKCNKVTYVLCWSSVYVLVSVTLSGILKAKQKLGVTLNFEKQGVINFKHFSKITMCRNKFKKVVIDPL